MVCGFVILKKALGTFLFAGCCIAIVGCDSPEERMQTHYERATDLLKKNEHVKAGLEFRNALTFDNDYLPGLRGLAEVEERNANWRVVAGVLRRIINLDPKEVEARVKLAKLMLVSNQTKPALELANVAHKIVGEAGDAVTPKVRADVLSLRASVLYRLGDKDGAVKSAKDAIAADPDNVDAQTVLAAERLAAKDTKSALAHIDAALKTNEKNAALQLFKIQILASLKDSEGVESVFRKLTTFNPTNQRIAMSFARFYLVQKRPVDAENVLRSVVTASPDDPNPSLTLARFMLETQGADKAKEELVSLIAKGGKVFPFQLALARLHVAQKQTAEAEKILNNVISADGTTTDARTAQVELAKIMLATRRRDETKALIEKVLATDERNVEGLVIRAALLVDEQKLDDAIRDLRLALNEQPRSARILMLLGEVYERNGQIELADEQFVIAAKLAKYNELVGLTYTQFLLRHSRLERAETVLGEILQRQPRSKPALNALANVRLRRQNWLGAQQVAETVRKLDKDGKSVADQINAAALVGQNKLDAGIQVLKGAFVEGEYPIQPMVALFNTYLRGGKEEDAKTLVESAIDANPSNAQAHVLLGTLHLRKGRRDEAKTAFLNAIEKQPKAIVGYRALAGWHLSGKDQEAAKSVIRDALKSQGESLVLRLTLAAILERESKYDEAIAEYETMLKSRPLAPILLNNLASLLADYRTDKDSLDRAYVLAKRLQTSPQAHFKDTLGWVYYRRGQFEPAAVLLKEARDALPKLPLVRYHLGMTYKALEQIGLAKEELSVALELAKTGKFDQKDKVVKALAELGS